MDALQVTRSTAKAHISHVYVKLGVHSHQELLSLIESVPKEYHPISPAGRCHAMAKMTVYHGSYTIVRDPRVIVGRNTKDFGPGFYCTVIREQAERWAKRRSVGFVSTYAVRLRSGLDILEFADMTEEWLDFIIACRSGKPHAHDIVIGAMANDQVYNYVSDYMDGSITRDQFWALARFKYPTHQICFCTPTAMGCLEFVGAEEVGR